MERSVKMHCRIHIKGHLDPSWQEWLGGLTILHDASGATLLVGTLPDQAALHGVLMALRRLNLSLLDFTTKETSQGEEHSEEDVQDQREKGVTSMSYTKKIALITGANKGIGFEIARQLGEQGNVVLIGARDLARGSEAAQKLQAEGIEAHAIQLDVTDQATIDAAASSLESTYGRLDILVNNAGISLGEYQTPPSILPIEILRKTYETNVFGVFAVTKALLPLLRRSEAGRIVNQSSTMGSLSLNSDPASVYANMPPLLAYNSSKTALNALTVFFANELRKTSIKVNAVSPGYCATDLNHHSGRMTAAQGAHVAVRLATIATDGPTGGFFEGDEIAPW